MHFLVSKLYFTKIQRHNTVISKIVNLWYCFHINVRQWDEFNHSSYTSSPQYPGFCIYRDPPGHIENIQGNTAPVQSIYLHLLLLILKQSYITTWCMEFALYYVSWVIQRWLDIREDMNMLTQTWFLFI